MRGEGKGRQEAEEPQTLGLLAHTEVLKSGSSCGEHEHDMPMPRHLGTVTRDARQAGGRANPMHKNKNPVRPIGS